MSRAIVLRISFVLALFVALAGMPGLTYTRSKSLFGLSHLRNQFDYGIDFEKCKQEVINRLSLAQLPQGVTPQLSPRSPLGEFFRYTLKGPRDRDGREVSGNAARPGWGAAAVPLPAGGEPEAGAAQVDLRAALPGNQGREE